ncbi:PLD-like domain-containing protein [Flavobacterium micromati]|uniref:phospholipase D n=1 Tax=Flavobacterium micromati TaxID=229205 RepID=A0A1M5R1J7_9FLAO|nr:phospholipase D-like domain-containing protein [Flavobacterium micromati]SHH20265.1 PLD-like domain-containing protein [Flavobacterium micromati]
MFYNGANCDIYIGKGAGHKLLNDIHSAKKSVKVVSPYLSPFLISELINLNKRSLEVELITSDNIEDFYGDYDKNLHKLIIQNKETDYLAEKKREKWKNILRILTYSWFGILTILVGTAFYLKNMKVVYGIIPLILLFFIGRYFKNKIKNKRIYTYWYSQLFHFKVYLSPDKANKNAMFIHSKIYLIDEKIAYLGSLNFTASGVKHNYETRIRTDDPNAIIEIKNEIYQLLNNSNLPQRDIQSWGRQLYKEPIN